MGMNRRSLFGLLPALGAAVSVIQRSEAKPEPRPYPEAVKVPPGMMICSTADIPSPGLYYTTSNTPEKP